MPSSISRRAFLKWGTLAVAASAIPTSLTACQPAIAPEAPLLNVHNWPEYLNPDTVLNFTKATGIQVVLTEFDGNDALYESLTSSQGGLYDVIVPSSHLTRQLIAEDRLLKLDKNRLPNFKNLMPRFQTGRPHDKDSNYSIAKTWGITGLLWNPDVVTEPVKKWADLWALAPKYAGQVSVVDEAVDVIGAALQMLGYSYNSEDADQLREAEAKLMELRPHVTIETDYFISFSEQTTVLSIGWNGDAYLLNSEYDTPIQFAIPQDGASYFEDDWCIPVTASHPNNAHVFLNYLLDPTVAAAESEYLGYPTVVTPALELLPAEIRTNPTLYPADDLVHALETIQPISDTAQKQRDAIWERFTTGV